MRLSEAGKIADNLWHEIVNHTNNVRLGEFIVMPNHIHGVIIIDNPNVDIVETRHALSLQGKTEGQFRFRNPGKNTVSSIIGGYKSAVTKQCNKLSIDFAWQPRFHDHIVRDDAEYSRIVEYIAGNPHNWKTDQFFVETRHAETRHALSLQCPA